jgi:beta-mannosidase
MNKTIMRALLFIALLFVSHAYAKEDMMSQTIELNAAWEFKQADEASWKKANVPGCVHLDLMRNGAIEDPFYRANEKRLQWIENKDWEYRAVFKATNELLAHERIELDFRGLDTYADVYLNDKLILKADNMFVAWTVEVKSVLKAGDNTLRVFFHSPIKHVMPQYEASPVEYPASNDVGEVKVSVYTRKAPYHYGWDWGPRFVTSGIWRPIYLRAWSKAQIRGSWIKQESLTDLKAALDVELEIESTQDGDFSVEIKSPANEFKPIAQTVKLKSGLNKINIPLAILAPKRWWPNGLGEQKLYGIQISLKNGASAIDSKRERVGLRDLEVVNKPDKDGESFFVKVNGRAVFMKGANYIPSDSFLTRVTPERYRRMFEDMKSANFNMVRIWGGGIYEEDLFYDLADQYGILLWHDFMFACSLYPAEDAFLKRVEHEAEYNIKRLRNHASLALWCGNNEIDVAWKNWGWQRGLSSEQKQMLAQGYDKIFRSLLPDKVKRLDPQRFYAHTSPLNNATPTDIHLGDSHFWGVWHAELPFSEYNKYISRFMSEYGFQSFPDIKTMERFALREDWNIESDVLKLRQKSGRGNGIIKKYMEAHYRAPKDFPSFLYLSQLLQAEGIKVGIEAHRRNMPFCMGTLYWQFNDCWPAISWSGIDYYGRWKALHYFAKKVYEPVLIAPYVDGDEMKIYIVSDARRDTAGVLSLELFDFKGKSLWKHSLTTTISANTSKTYYAVNLPATLENLNREEVFLSIKLDVGKATVSQSVQYFAQPKNLRLVQPNISFNAQQAKSGGIELKLKTDVLAKNIYLDFEGDTTNFFSDNFFDVLPNEERIVKVKTKLSPEEIKKRLKIKTLVDSYYSTLTN